MLDRFKVTCYCELLKFKVLPWSLTIADQQPHSTEVIACLDLHI